LALGNPRREVTAIFKLGFNTVLFGGHDLRTAMQHAAWAGYDGVELSAIKGMCEHLVLDDFRSHVVEIRDMGVEFGLALLAMEVASLDEERLIKAFQAAAELGIPVVNIGPGGKSDVEEDFKRQVGQIAKMAQKAEELDQKEEKRMILRMLADQGKIKWVGKWKMGTEVISLREKA